MEQLLELIAAGGDGALIYVAVALYQLNRRVNTLETKITVLTTAKI